MKTFCRFAKNVRDEGRGTRSRQRSPQKKGSTRPWQPCKIFQSMIFASRTTRPSFRPSSPGNKPPLPGVNLDFFTGFEVGGDLEFQTGFEGCLLGLGLGGSVRDGRGGFAYNEFNRHRWLDRDDLVFEDSHDHFGAVEQEALLAVGLAEPLADADWFGPSVSPIGDLDGDGVAEE